MDASALACCTFDCYGTLIDWEGGLGAFLYDFGLRSGDSALLSGGELRERWEAIQFELIQGEYRRYADVLADSLRRLAEERGWPYTEDEGKALARSMRSWQAFADTAPALRRAQAAGLRLIIVSNTDLDILEHSLRQIEVPIDAVVTAEDVRSYKPAKPHFERALEVAKVPAEQILHVAFGFKYDIGPAQELGFRSAWVNRRGEPRPGPARPDLEWRSLWGLAELADARRAPSNG